MGFNLGKKKGLISEINVTPLVDVMLVLLIIFMISAPLMFSGIKLQLPKTKKVNAINLSDEQVIVSMTPSGEFFIGQQKYLYEELISNVQKQLKQTSSQTLFFRADFQIRYGKVAKLMSEFKRAGITNIALVTENEKKK